MALSDGFYSLSNDVNKVHPDVSDDGVVSKLLPELELSMSDDDLIDLKRDWIKIWEPYSKEIEKKQIENENYWLGSQFSSSKEGRPLVDNLIFESLETFLPIATRAKADPVVEADNTEEGNALADKVRKMLSFIANNLSYNLKVKQVARYWALYHLGVIKVGWSMKENDITCIAVRPQKLILDPNATIEECDYKGEYIGEYLDDTASNLVLRFPKKKAFIESKVNIKMGTKVQYLMWTTDDYVFWTLDDEVLAKSKNPHWNYETQQPGPTDEVGQQGPPQRKAGNNHFKTRRKPYVFLSIFNIGKHPHDDTNLIQQNLPLQDLINKRLAQMDKNADNANGGLIVSGDAFTEEQAKKASDALRKGGVVWVPTGDVNNTVKRDSGAPMPNFVYETLVDYRNELRNIFGTRGSTAQGTIQDRTVRGKQQIKGQDSDRIGGGISTYLEEFSDHVFNWFVQLMYVYYDEPHEAAVLGSQRAKEYIKLHNQEFSVRLTVGVKDGSMIPHDPAAKRDEAIQLWSQQGIDPVTLFDRLEFPNPRETAKQLFLWHSDPIQLFPDLAQQQGPKQPEQKAPSVSIGYAEMPPEAQAQLLKQIGIEVDPQALQAHAQQAQAQDQQKAQLDMQLKAQEGQQKLSQQAQAHEIKLVQSQQAHQQAQVQEGQQAVHGMKIKQHQVDQQSQMQQQAAQQKGALQSQAAHQSMSLKEQQAAQAATLQKRALLANPKHHAGRNKR